MNVEVITAENHFKVENAFRASRV